MQGSPVTTGIRGNAALLNRLFYTTLKTKASVMRLTEVRLKLYTTADRNGSYIAEIPTTVLIAGPL